jgi:hypothetical protein
MTQNSWAEPRPSSKSPREYPLDGDRPVNSVISSSECVADLTIRAQSAPTPWFGPSSRLIPGSVLCFGGLRLFNVAFLLELLDQIFQLPPRKLVIILVAERFLVGLDPLAKLCGLSIVEPGFLANSANILVKIRAPPSWVRAEGFPDRARACGSAGPRTHPNYRGCWSRRCSPWGYAGCCVPNCEGGRRSRFDRRAPTSCRQ